MSEAIPPKTPARVLRIEIAPPSGASLNRTMEVARAVAAEFEADRPVVEFLHGNLRVMVQEQGAA